MSLFLGLCVVAFLILEAFKDGSKTKHSLSQLAGALKKAVSARPSDVQTIIVASPETDYSFYESPAFLRR